MSVVGKLIGSIKVGVIADTSKATKSMKKFQGDVRQTSKGISASMKSMGTALVAGLGAAVVYKVADAFAETVGQMDSMIKTAKKIGLGTNELVGLQHAAKLTGVETNALNMALQRMTRRVSEAAAGTGEAKDAIKELGLDAKRLNDIGTAAAFSKIAEAFRNIKNPADQLRLAFKLFDSEGAALVNTLRLGSTGLADMAAEAKALGLTMSDDVAKGVEDVADEMERLGKKWAGAKQIMASKVVPFAADYLEGVNAYMSGASKPGYAGAITPGERQAINSQRQREAAARIARSKATNPYHNMSPGAEIIARTRDAHYKEQTEKARKAIDRIVDPVNWGRAIGSGLLMASRMIPSRKKASPFDMAIGEATTQAARDTSRGFNSIVDANSREGFAALRANMRKSATKQLEELGLKQVKELEGINDGVSRMVDAMTSESLLSIPGNAGG